MTYLGTPTNSRSVPIWDGAKWIQYAPDAPALSGGYSYRTASTNRATTQMIGHGALANVTYSFTPYTTNTVATFFQGMFFDGVHVWTTENGVNQRVRRRDWGTLLHDLTVDSSSLGFAIDPIGITSDGQDIYFISTTSNRLVRIDRSTGALITSITMPDTPKRIFNNGEYIWVASSTQLHVVTDPTVPTISSLSGFSDIMEILYDGRFIWVVDKVSGGQSKLYKINYLPLVIEASYNIGTVAADPRAATFDGTYIWIAFFTNPGQIIRVHTISGVTETFLLTGILNEPEGIAFDGYVIVVATNSATFVRLDPLSGRLYRNTNYTSPVGGGTGTPGFMTCIGPGSLLFSTTGGGIGSLNRMDVPSSQAYYRLGIGADATSASFPRTDVKRLTLSAATGTVPFPVGSATPGDGPGPADSLIAHVFGTLSGATRLEPEGGTVWYIYNDTSGAALTFGTSFSSVSLGALGASTIVRLDPATGDFAIVNQYP